MRILHYCNSFSPLSETFIYDYISELENQGIDNHVVSHHRLNIDERPFNKVAIIDTPGRWNPEKLIRRLGTEIRNENPAFSSWPIIRRRLEKIVKTIKPDIIHAHFGPEGSKIAPVAKKLDVPLITTFYGYDISKLVRDNFWINEYQNLFNSSNTIVGISNHICSKLCNIGAPENKVELLHLGIKLENFTYQEPPQKGEQINCLHVGRLVEKKSPINLVRAFKYVSDSISEDINLQLKVAGDGPLKNDLQKEIEKLKMEDKIQVLGAIPHMRVPELMKEADIYTQHCVTASDGDQEGQGVTFVEASAVGLPIVGTKHNGLPDVILNDETGFLVDEGDYKEMGKKIVQLIQNPDLRFEFGKNGRKHVEENFDLKKQARKALEIYSRL